MKSLERLVKYTVWELGKDLNSMFKDRLSQNEITTKLYLFQIGFTPETVRKMDKAQILYDQNEDIKLQIEEKPKPRPPAVVAPNWMADYFKTPSPDRFVWPTKLYASKFKFEDKPLFEQVEILTDLSAKDFVKWLNELGQEKSDVTEEMVKKLFSIGIEEGVSKALKFGNKYVGAVSDNVANYWNLPHKGLEATIARVKAEEKKFRAKATKPCEMFDEPEIIPPIFKEVRTFERTFKGITNLASIGLLIDYLKANPEIERPKYLRDKGLFKPKKEADLNAKKKEQPLHERAQ